MRLVPPLDQLGQYDRELAVFNRSACARNVECAIQAHSACEAAELALDEVKRLLLCCSGRRLFACDHQNTSSKEDAERVWRNAADFDDDFNRFVCFEHVQGGVAFARKRPQVVRQIGGQILEQLAHIVCQLACFSRRDERKLGHRR